MQIFVNFENGDGVMVFFDNLTLTPEEVKMWAEFTAGPVLETYEVRDDELQYYCYSPVWADDAQVEYVRKNFLK